MSICRGQAFNSDKNYHYGNYYGISYFVRDHSKLRRRALQNKAIYRTDLKSQV